MDTEKERRHVADTLNKIYIESFDNNALGEILSTLGEEPKNLGSNKRLQKIMESIASKEDISSIMSPFYVLYDLRVAYSHLGSKDGSTKRLESVKNRLGLEAGSQLNEIYNAVVEQLSSSYTKLSSVVKNCT